MKAIAINGGPRKGYNTDTLLSKALQGAASQGAETEMIYLYDLNFKGCVSCFSCKRKNGKSYGKCTLKDDLRAVLQKVEEADALLIGSPIYLGAVTGEMRSFLERLLFQYLVYDKERSTLAPKQMKTGCIYTMNVDEQQMKEAGYEQILRMIERTFTRIFGSSETMFVTDTYQFDDYSKYVATSFDEKAKDKRRREVFPIDCQRAFDMGAKLVQTGE